jgi:putative (di)nucleoside polyphosphate hydrolase
VIGEKKSGKYRPCVGIVLIKNGMVFAAQRIGYQSSAWQMPQGGIEDKETPRKAAIRELREETGISKENIEIICQTADWVKYDLPNELVPKLWGGKYVGQKQIWFAINYLGLDKDININTENPEFCAWKWMEKEEIKEKIVPFKKSVYKKIFDEFSRKTYLK